MIRLPDDARILDVEGATVDFFTFNSDGFTCIYFDSSHTAVPEPMVNAMCGLRLLDSSAKKLVMINHQKPMGLLGKIEEKFDIEIFDRDDGNFQIQFGYKKGLSQEADLNDTHCSG